MSFDRMRSFFLKVRTPEVLLMLMASAVPLSFSTWSTLISNFTIEEAGFSGAQFGILQSLREIPGFLAFLVVFVLIILKEQKLALAKQKKEHMLRL